MDIVRCICLCLIVTISFLQLSTCAPYYEFLDGDKVSDSIRYHNGLSQYGGNDYLSRMLFDRRAGKHKRRSLDMIDSPSFGGSKTFGAGGFGGEMTAEDLRRMGGDRMNFRRR